MTTVKIELQFNRSGVTKDDVYEYLNELMSDDNLDFYSISIHQDGKQKEFEWDHKEFWKGRFWTMSKNVSYDFGLDSIIAIDAPIGTDPDTLIEQAKQKLIERIREGNITFRFENIWEKILKAIFLFYRKNL